MKFFEISEGRCINLDEIEAVERINDLNCRIITEFHEYEAKYPYSTIVSILNSHSESKEDSDNTKILKDISEKIGNQGFFAG